MNEINWPDELGEPLKAGYNYTLGSSRNTANVVGSSLTRTTSARHNTAFSVSYLWDDEQLQRFDQFCKGDTHFMQSWFSQTLLLGDDLIEQSVRIVEVAPFSRDQMYWQVKLTLECPDRYLIDDETANAIMRFGSEEVIRIIEAAGRYYQTVNYLMPYGRTEYRAILTATHQYHQQINYRTPDIYDHR